MGALVFKQIVFAAISFTGPMATGVAFAFAVSVVGLWAGVIVRLQGLSRLPIRSGLEILTAPLAFSVRPAARGGACSAWPAIAAAAWFLSRRPR